VLADFWICSYPLLSVVVLILLAFWSPQAPEFTMKLNEDLAPITPAGATVFPFVATAIAVAYCSSAIFFSAVAALGQVRHEMSTVPYWLGGLCLLSSAGVIFGDRVALWLIGITILALLLVPAFGAPGVRFHTIIGKVGVNFAIALLTVGAAIAEYLWFETIAGSRALTTWPIVYFAFGFWTLFWTLLVIWIPRSFGLPSFWLVPLIIAAVFSNFHDDHGIRMLDPAASRPKPAATLNVEYVKKWLHKRCSRRDQVCTVRFVAAQGGGQRSAYWTQKVLRELNRSNRDFDRSVFAFSGVSGGSIGGLSYFLARSTRLKNWDTSLEKFASSDNLAPIVTALLYREVVQAFIPRTIPLLDGRDRSRVASNKRGKKPSSTIRQRVS